MSKIIYKDESCRIVGACFDVYNNLGHGLLEAVYQEALSIEFSDQGIPFEAHPKLEILYKNRILKQHYIPDFLCFDQIIIEVKSSKAIDDSHRAQILNYLKLSKKKLGLIINFGSHPGVQHERFAL